MLPTLVTTAHESFQTPLIVEYEDGHNWVIYEQFTYCSPRICVHIPKGFETDFASIPRILWRFMSPTDGHIGKPAVVHDYLYRTPSINCTREDADNELRAAMAVVGASWWQREMVFKAVRTFGGHSFKERSPLIGTVPVPPKEHA